MLAFLLSAFVISLSGALAPGPVTAATLAAGARARHAGAQIAIGHLLVELPLIVLLAMGAGSLIDSPGVSAAIALAGGLVLLVLGGQLLLSLRSNPAPSGPPVQKHPVLIGVVLTLANPYFFVWWATVGLALTTQAMAFGLTALALFAAVHWLCDLGALEALSLAGFKGSERFGARAQTVVAGVCGAMLTGFGVKFLVDAAIWLPTELSASP